LLDVILHGARDVSRLRRILHGELLVGDAPDRNTRMSAVAPDLVVEVRSPTDRWNAIFAKVSEYLTAGVRVVVVLDPATTSASVYRMDELQQIFHHSDVLTLPDVLAGFSVVVSRLFE